LAIAMFINIAQIYCCSSNAMSLVSEEIVKLKGKLQYEALLLLWRKILITWGLHQTCNGDFHKPSTDTCHCVAKGTCFAVDIWQIW